MRSVGGWTEAEKQKKHRPQGIVDAQFSIPFTVAATLVNRRLSLEEFTDANLSNEKVLALAGRVTPVLDRELDNGPLDVKRRSLKSSQRTESVFANASTT